MTRPPMINELCSRSHPALRCRQRAGPIVLPITVHETRIELTLETADLLPEQENHERSDTVATLERMLERLCGIDVP